MQRAFVTGGTGFVGFNLIRELLAHDVHVVALHRASSDLTRLRPLDVELVEGDILEPASLAAAMPEGVDVVFHVAASTEMWALADARQTRINLDGTVNVLEAALERGAGRLVHTSTLAAYGFHDEPITEETPSTALESGINYMRTKRLAELEVERAIERGLDAVIINPSHVVGPYDEEGWVQMIRLVAAEKLPGVPPGEGSFCDVREVARAHRAAAERGRVGRRYLLGGTEASYLEMVREIGRVLGKETPDKPTPAWMLRAIGRLSGALSHLTRREPDLTPEKVELVCRHLVCSSEAAERELGYRPVPLATMLEAAIDWLREEGRLDA